MINIDTLLFFLFVFSMLSTFRVIFKFLVSLIQNPPEKMILNQKSLFFYGICLSYVITYLIKN